MEISVLQKYNYGDKFRIRYVQLPDDFYNPSFMSTNDLLNAVFAHGQNDDYYEIYEKHLANYRSVSVGDIIFLPDGSKYEVLDFGFGKLT